MNNIAACTYITGATGVFRINFLRWLWLLMGVVVLVACSRETAAPTPQYTSTPTAADTKTHYVFLVHPLQNPQLLHQKFEPLMNYLAEQLPGTAFDLQTSSDYADFEQKLRQGGPHFALPNPYHATLARDWGYHVIAKMGNDDLFRGVFIVRKDSPIRVVADLRGKVVAYPAPTALAAAMMPQLYLQNSSIMNAYLRQSDASATWPVAWAAFEQSNPKEAAELKVIWQTPTLIQNAVLARQNVPAPVAAEVTRVLTQLQDTPAGQLLLKDIDTVSFVAASDADFEIVRTFLKEFNTLVRKEK